MSSERYRDFEVYPTDPLPPIPTWREFAWTYVHKDYDGEGDHRCGHAPSSEECKREIDDWHEDQDYAVAAVFTPQVVDLILNDRMSHGDLASRLAQARELARQGTDTSGMMAAILSAWEFHK